MFPLASTNPMSAEAADQYASAPSTPPRGQERGQQAVGVP